MQSNYRLILPLLLIIFSFAQCQILEEGNQVNAKEDKELQFRTQVIDFAKEQLGTKYRYAGKDPRGFDCSGFTYYVMKNFDIALNASSKTQINNGSAVDLKEVRTGDLIFFKRSKMGPIFHVAMVVDKSQEGLEVIHSTSRGVVIDNISTSKYWEPKVFAARDVISK